MLPRAGDTESAPDFVEPLEAWRVWRVVETPAGLALASVVKGVVWPVREPLAAECMRCGSLLGWLRRREPHAVPEPDCECGIYAAGLRDVQSYLRGLLPEALARVVGRVALWGTVVECERGYRASHAYPLSLYVVGHAVRGHRVSPADVADGLGRYGVPVECLDEPRRFGFLPDLQGLNAREP